MASPSQQGIPVGGYFPALSEYDYGIRHAYLKFTDNYAKYFKQLGIRRYEMMKVMPFMMNSDVLIGLDKPDYVNEDKKTQYTVIKPKIENKVIKCSSSFIDKIEISFVEPELTGMSDKQKHRIDKEGMSRWFLKIYHKKDKLTEELINNINDVIVHKNALKVKYLKCQSELCYYISQKSRIAGQSEAKQDIRNAPVVIEPLHNDIFNMVIPHIPINQSLPIGTKVIISIDIPFKGPESQRKFIWSSNIDYQQNMSDIIKSEKSNSIYLKPWLECVHISSIDLGSSLKGKFSVEETDPSLQQSYQIYTFRRDANDEYFELGMYVCYNMLPIDLVNKLLEELPKNEYLKEVKKELDK